MTGARAPRSSGLAACHQQADAFSLSGGGVELADHAAAVDHDDPIGKLEHLVEVRRHEQHRRARVPLGDRAPVDELAAADVDAARRLIEDEESIAAELSRDDELLL